MDVEPHIDDPLIQPTRARLFKQLTELRRSASTEELAEQLAMHPNGVRLHLERLAKAGLVVRERERGARGRPRDSWSITADAQPGGNPPTAYADLSRWLVRLLARGRMGIRDVESVGRELGRDLASEGSDADKESRFFTALVALGFQPTRESTEEPGTKYCLRNCPYRDAVSERQALVCGLHRGMTRGMLDVIDPKTKLAGFVPKDPYAAGCEIEVRGLVVADPASAADRS